MFVLIKHHYMKTW